MRGLLCSPTVPLGLSMLEGGVVGSAIHHTACPLLCHSESGRLGLSVCECGVAGSASGPTACPVRPTLRQCESSPPQLPSPPLLQVWMNVYFLFTLCRTSLTFDFLSVLVVRGGAVCLPTPPSWLGAELPFFRTFSQSIEIFLPHIIIMFRSSRLTKILFRLKQLLR